MEIRMADMIAEVEMVTRTDVKVAATNAEIMIAVVAVTTNNKTGEMEEAPAAIHLTRWSSSKVCHNSKLPGHLYLSTLRFQCK
jgi:hypothetical protein